MWIIHSFFGYVCDSDTVLDDDDDVAVYSRNCNNPMAWIGWCTITNPKYHGTCLRLALRLAREPLARLTAALRKLFEPVSLLRTCT